MSQEYNINRVLKWSIGGTMGTLVLMIVYNTVISSDKDKYVLTKPMPDLDLIPVPSGKDNLKRALQYKSYKGNDVEIQKMVDLVKEYFEPRDGVIKHEVKPNENEDPDPNILLYEWTGSNSSLRPVLITSHLDVVGAEENPESEIGPWDGYEEDGIIWGRGAQDMKATVIASLEAFKYLYDYDKESKTFTPERTIMFMFTRDEETDKKDAIAIYNHLEEYLKTRFDLSGKLECILDEGGAFLGLSFISKQHCAVGIAQKGYLTMEATIKGKGGHSARPRKKSLSKAFAKLIQSIEKNQMKKYFGDTEKAPYRAMAPHAKFPYNVLFSNLSIFSPVLKMVASMDDTQRAQLQTTTALVNMNAGTGEENALPTQGTVMVNHRIHPNDTIEDVVKNYEKFEKNDVEVKRLGDGIQPSKVSSTESDFFKAIHRQINSIFGETVILPIVSPVATDSSKFWNIVDVSFGLPLTEFQFGETVHADNERISIEHFNKLTRLYQRLIEDFSSS